MYKNEVLKAHKIDTIHWHCLTKDNNFKTSGS